MAFPPTPFLTSRSRARTLEAPSKGVPVQFEDFKTSPMFGVAMLKVSFDLKNKTDRRFEEILEGILSGMEIDRRDFQSYLKSYRAQLVQSVLEKGY
jgi:hypothetical protein